MSKSAFYDCPHCGAGGIIPDEDGRCTHCKEILVKADSISKDKSQKKTANNINNGKSKITTANLACPKCGSEDIRRIGLDGLIICIVFIILLILARYMLVRIGDKEMASNPNRYKNALSNNYEPSDDRYDFPLTTQFGAALEAISVILIIYAIYLFIVCLGGKKKCTKCKFKFKGTLNSVNNK